MKSVPSGDDADSGEWTGKVFRNEVPCIVGSDVELIRGGWTVLGYDAASDKYDLGLDDSDG
eukprot:6081877-Prymnesium_polylepis.1